MTSPLTKAQRDDQYTRLRDMLIYDEDEPKSDLADICGPPSKLSKARQDKIRSVPKPLKLLRWIDNEKSSVLLLNGEKRSEDRKRIRAAAASTSAQIASELEDGHIGEKSNSIPLYFFCGKHPPSENRRWNSPIGIANSFIGQLLEKSKHLDLTEALNLPRVKGLGSTSDALKVLEVVLARIKADVTVYFIIDDITCYRRGNQLRQDTAGLLNKLIGLIKKPPEGITCRVKLLLTAPGGISLEAYDIDDCNVLTIPAGDKSEPGEKASGNAAGKRLDLRR